MAAVPYDGASGGAALFYPQTDCFAAWDLFLVQSAKLFIGSISGGGADECVQWIVLVDGAVAGFTREDCFPNDFQHLQVFVAGLSSNTFTQLLQIPPGLHVVTVVASYTDGPHYANTHVDYLEFAN